MPEFGPPPTNDLTPEENRIRNEFCRDLQTHFDKYVARYLRRHRRHLDPDLARNFWPEYARKPKRRAALSRATYWPARAFIDCLFKKLIESPKPVVFLSGGPGAGKSTARSLPELRGILRRAACVLDGTLSRPADARSAIRACVKAHPERRLVIVHVYCQFEEAVRRIIRRAQDPKNGRVVTLNSAARVHRASQDTLLELAREFDGQIDFVVVGSFPNSARLLEVADLERKYRLEPLDQLTRKAHEVFTHVVAENEKAGTPLSPEIVAALQADTPH